MLSGDEMAGVFTWEPIRKSMVTHKKLKDDSTIRRLRNRLPVVMG